MPTYTEHQTPEPTYKTGKAAGHLLSRSTHKCIVYNCRILCEDKEELIQHMRVNHDMYRCGHTKCGAFLPKDKTLQHIAEHRVFSNAGVNSDTEQRIGKRSKGDANDKGSGSRVLSQQSQRLIRHKPDKPGLRRTINYNKWPSEYTQDDRLYNQLKSLLSGLSDRVSEPPKRPGSLKELCYDPTLTLI